MFQTGAKNEFLFEFFVWPLLIQNRSFLGLLLCQYKSIFGTFIHPKIHAASAVRPIESEGVVQRAEMKRFTNTFSNVKCKIFK